MWKIVVGLLVLFVLGVSSNGGSPPPPGACPGQRDDLLLCFDQLVDLDHDGIITLSELNATMENVRPYVPGAAEYPTVYTDANMYNACNVIDDGALNATDWNDPNGCLQLQESRDFICRLCYIAGYAPVKK